MNNLRDGVDGLSTLERADMRNEVNAWYDGYMDNACDRAKFESAPKEVTEITELLHTNPWDDHARWCDTQTNAGLAAYVPYYL
jgi:hypothetical protein